MPFMESVRVVREFVDMFHNNIFVISPDHDIDFGIDLKPSIAPIFAPLYRMALIELNELKN